MESYKPRKNSEISLYPIELTLKKMQDENKRNFKNTIYKTSAAFLSGIGTIFLFQNKYLYNIVETLFEFFEWNCTSWEIGILTFIMGAALFFIINIIAWGLCKVIDANEDSKRNKNLREDIAEYFHKVILNNIIMGLSFAKKASNLLTTKASKNQCCFYTSQALFYLKTAIRELDKKQIFEAGGREQYLEFIDEVGWITLYETLHMLNSTFREIDNIIEVLSDKTQYCWERDIVELNELKREKRIIEKMRTITGWETQLLELLECMNKKEEM